MNRELSVYCYKMSSSYSLYTTKNTSTSVTRYGVSIGINEFNVLFRTLKYCANDSLHIANLYRQRSKCFTNTDIKVISGTSDKANIMKDIWYQAYKCNQNDMFVMHISSHGGKTEDGCLYFVASDTTNIYAQEYFFLKFSK